MSSLLVIGGDKLGAIPDNLKNLGFKDVIHIDGRKVQMVKKEIPDHIDIILILTDYINHNLAKKIKNKASKKEIPICYARRSWCAIYSSLTNCEIACEQCPFLSHTGQSNRRT
ncbi:hypothetical protein SAMN05421736_101284 [Evansella caseinilytica]|uniref:Dihydroorotate dehydrogenase n=1 Tax=Evansella caseinilytica TaxID=1503961 RepID=A0A1H3GUD1_9BACI|nr:DUF2325 domain-containing protein [Evansella caseinilytica]SDY06727.1 hypothetical protein SAMN05421736_101284 [Evansella caseinilytica]